MKKLYYIKKVYGKLKKKKCNPCDDCWNFDDKYRQCIFNRHFIKGDQIITDCGIFNSIEDKKQKSGDLSAGG